MKRVLVLSAVAGVALVAAAVAADSVKSGLQPGDRVTPFHPLNVTGSFAGQKQCLV